MIDLLEYFDNYVEGTYYERFCDRIRSCDAETAVVFGLEPSILEFKLYDEVELEDKFRSICQPPDDYTSEDESWFILISFYFFHHNIYIFDSFQNFLNAQGGYLILLTLILDSMLLIIIILMET